MERIMSVEDKIRRAEEIYNRRRAVEQNNKQVRVATENNNNYNSIKLNKKLKKMIIQIIICMLIYFIFHYIVNNDYIFSSDFRKKCEEILSYDISFSKAYENAQTYITNLKEKYEKIIPKNNEENIITQKKEETKEDNNEEKQEDNNVDKMQDNNDQNTEINNQGNQNEINSELEEQSDGQSIGGSREEIISKEETKEAEVSENLTEEEQMNKDAEDIKSKISFISPLKGTITSVFGWRNPKVSTVSKYHTGIDIGANQGTDIISATNGKVILASSQGAYGNHLKIQIEDVIILYAHCLTLNVSEGDEILQGQKIAKVGSTGNSTGPHLHFEIRKEDRYVNPQLILDF